MWLDQLCMHHKHHPTTVCGAAWTQKAFEQRLRKWTWATNHPSEAGCFFLYFEIISFYSCFSEMNLLSAEFTVDSIHYHHHPPAPDAFHFFNQWLCLRFKASALRFKSPGRKEWLPEIRARVPDPCLTSHSMWCFPTNPPALIPLVLSLMFYQALSHFRVFTHATFSHLSIITLIPTAFCITNSCSPFKCQLKYNFPDPLD